MNNSGQGYFYSERKINQEFFSAFSRFLRFDNTNNGQL